MQTNGRRATHGVHKLNMTCCEYQQQQHLAPTRINNTFKRVSIPPVTCMSICGSGPVINNRIDAGDLRQRLASCCRTGGKHRTVASLIVRQLALRCQQQLCRGSTHIVVSLAVEFPDPHVRTLPAVSFDAITHRNGQLLFFIPPSDRVRASIVCALLHSECITTRAT